MPGIDQQIEQRKMQFGANPQALQQRYGQSKQLLDLLALQQIAAEQQQKSQAMALQMQQNPATVADQLEQEVIQGKKAEMAQSLQGMQAMRAPKRSQSDTARGVAGVLAQKQREQQSRMQKMAGSGIAGQPARNMERMYNGGIVGYERGGRVQALIDEYRKKTYGAANLSDEEILSLMERQRPTTIEEYRRKIYGAANKSDEEIQQAIDESYSGRLKAATTADISDKGSRYSFEDDLGMPIIGAAGQEPLNIQRAVQEPEVDVEEVVSFDEEKISAPTPTPTPKPKPTPTDPGLMQRMAQQKQELSQAGEDILGTPQLGGLEVLARQPQVPEMLRRPAGMPAPAAPAAKPEPTTEEKILQQYLQGLTQQNKALAAEEEALKARYSGRSKGQKILDRLITAAQMQSQGAPARTNRQALSRLLGGYTVASGQERKAEEEGLAKLAERRSGLLSTQMSGLGSLAQIKRGEALTEQGARGLDIQEAQGARGLDLEAERIGVSRDQLAQTATLAAKELEFKYSKLDKDSEHAAKIASIQTEANQIQRDFNNARNEQAKQNLLVKYEELILDYDNAIDSALKDEIEAIRLAPDIRAAERPTKIQEARSRATTAKNQRRKMLRDLQKQATGVDMGSFAPTTGGALSSEDVVAQARTAIEGS